MAQQVLGLRGAAKENFYFGVSAGEDAATDESYPDAMTALAVRADDCIYFALLLAHVLGNHAGALQLEYGHRLTASSEVYCYGRISSVAP